MLWAGFLAIGNNECNQQSIRCQPQCNRGNKKCLTQQKCYILETRKTQYFLFYPIFAALLSFSANTTAFIAWPHSEWIIFHALLPFVLHHRSLQKQIILFIFSHILLEMKTFQIGKYRISKMETLPLNFWWHRRPIFFSYWTVSEVDHWPALAFLSEGNIRTLTTKISN